jgi:CRISPR-associated protein Cas5h
MDRIVAFTLRGPLAHFRRPDTLGTHATYPFIPRTALRGLIGSVLGLDGSELLPAEGRTAVRLCGPVRTVAQELSLHGKKWIGAGTNDSFHRPTSIELVVNPHYRAYYAGPRADELAERLIQRQSVYHTYLGSAFCLTVPDEVTVMAVEPLELGSEPLTCATVVPSAAVGRLELATGQSAARVGGVSLDHLGGRRFRGTVALLYDPQGGPMTFRAAEPPADAFWEFCRVAGEGVACLW